MTEAGEIGYGGGMQVTFSMVALLVILVGMPSSAIAQCASPVVVLHGWGGFTGGVTAVVEQLQDEGRTVVIPEILPSSEEDDVDDLVAIARTQIPSALRAAGCALEEAVDLVGYSLGGLLGWLLLHDDASEQALGVAVRHVVLVAAPLVGPGAPLAAMACRHLPSDPWRGVSCDLAPFSRRWGEAVRSTPKLSDGGSVHVIGVAGWDPVVPQKAMQVEANSRWFWRGAYLRRHTRLMCNSVVVAQIVARLAGDQSPADNQPLHNLCSM